jgi:uncharacterized protein YyaL (SSP411 family)
MANRLAAETSPYLLQHQDNPVDWHPWGPEALERARQEDKPILLSIGYSSCHWCHVMAHESFENPEVAEVMNRLFINIKVDREERPDLDQIYQTALQMLTRRSGGWPLTMFLSPDQTPFFGGTYFPPEPRFGLPGFAGLLENIALAFAERRKDIEAQNASLREALAESSPHAADSPSLTDNPIATALAQIKASFEPVYGGYSGAPKFPRPAELAFLLHHGDAEAREQVLFTLRKMAEGGIHDQVGGGFYRYSTDELWAIPHFEKMLYDNGPLLGLYADAWCLTGEPLFLQAAEMTVEWLQREMTDPEGAFYAALDADSEHEEGKFYVWTPAEVQGLLSPEEYAVAALHWGLNGRANFEGHAWHLLVAEPLPEAAVVQRLDLGTAAALLASARAKLFAAREGRTRPGRDDKILTSWNALMIKGLARAGRRLGRPDWTALAQVAVDTLRQRVWQGGRLQATWKDGQARHNGYLDDHAFLLDALLELLQGRFRREDLDWATTLGDALLESFEDTECGGFFFTRHDHEQLIHRTKPAYDNAMPSGNGVAALALGRLGHLTGMARHLDASERALRHFHATMADHPAPHPSLLTALHEHLNPATLVVLRGPQPELDDWAQQLSTLCRDDLLVLAIASDLPDLPPILAKPVKAVPTAFVCSGVKCLPEIVQIDELLAVLNG